MLRFTNNYTKYLFYIFSIPPNLFFFHKNCFLIDFGHIFLDYSKFQTRLSLVGKGFQKSANICVFCKYYYLSLRKHWPNSGGRLNMKLTHFLINNQNPLKILKIFELRSAHRKKKWA